MKIGLFLDAQPTSGGAFQYSATMLRALSHLVSPNLAVSAVYTDPVWKPHVNQLPITASYVRKGLWGPVACRRLSGILPLRPWRSACSRFHPIAKHLLQLACHVWIFPAQDTWTYLMPVPSVGVIFDLMHRYERRFPEVSSGGIYHSRERHYRKMCRWTQALIVDSEIGKQHVIESYGVAAHRVHVLPFIPPAHIANGDTQTPPDLDGLPHKFIFYPAQFWAHKNHGRLIEAVAQLKPKYPDMHIVLAGSPKNGYQASLKLTHRLNLADNIHFLGYVPDAIITTLYKRARALIMPTFFGPTNIPPLEAIRLGCPVAVSGIYGMPEQLGDAAIYFDPQSVDEIASALEKLWVDDKICKKLSAKGIRRAIEFTESRFAAKLTGILQDLTAGG